MQKGLSLSRAWNGLESRRRRQWMYSGEKAEIMSPNSCARIYPQWPARNGFKYGVPHINVMNWFMLALGFPRLPYYNVYETPFQVSEKAGWHDMYVAFSPWNQHIAEGILYSSLFLNNHEIYHRRKGAMYLCHEGKFLEGWLSEWNNKLA
jgi:hypothetical protein